MSRHTRPRQAAEPWWVQTDRAIRRRRRQKAIDAAISRAVDLFLELLILGLIAATAACFGAGLYMYLEPR